MFKKPLLFFLSILLLLLLLPSTATFAQDYWSGEEEWQTMTREEIIDKAKAMIEVEWEPQENFTMRGYSFSAGQTYTGIPYDQNLCDVEEIYKMDDLSTFKAKIDEGLKPYGNDCSCFVSICWKLTERYSTAEFHSDASGHRWNNHVMQLGAQGSAAHITLLPGDALNRRVEGCKFNHIILFYEYNEAGIKALEQTPGARESTSEMMRHWYFSHTDGERYLDGYYMPIRRRNIDTPPSTLFSTGEHLTVRGSGLNLRDEPGTQTGDYPQLERDETVKVLNHGDNGTYIDDHHWWYVETLDSDHGDGWLAETHLISAAEQPEGIALSLSSVNRSRFPRIDTFLNVTDTGGETIEGLTEDNFFVTEQAENEYEAFRQDINLRTAQEEENLAVALTIDRSGSMDGEPMQRAREAAKTMVDLLDEEDRCAIISFADNSRIDQPFTGNKESLKEAIEQIESDGWTALYDSIYDSINLTAQEVGLPAVIVFTDGIDNMSSKSADDVIELARQKNTPVYTIGYGDVESDVLERIADETGGYYKEIPDMTELEVIYEELASALGEQYMLVYRTHNEEMDGTERTIEVTVTINGKSVSDTITYRAVAAPVITLTDETKEKLLQQQPAEGPLDIKAEITSSGEIYEALLLYRTIGSGEAYNQVEMETVFTTLDNQSLLYRAEIPGEAVKDPGVEFYITAIDEENLPASSPRDRPSMEPHQISVHPNKKPIVIHDPIDSAEAEQEIFVSATVNNDPPEGPIEKVVLHYRRSGKELYQEITMDGSGDSYSSTIPADEVRGPALEYYISATDNHGVRGYAAGRATPHVIDVESEIKEWPQTIIPEKITIYAEVKVNDNEKIWKDKTLNFEEYIKGVVQQELGPSHVRNVLGQGVYGHNMSEDEILEALKAQAIAARTFAAGSFRGVDNYNGFWRRGKGIGRIPEDSNAVLLTGEDDQDWTAGPYNSLVEKAVDKTRGQVLTHDHGIQNGVINALYSSYFNSERKVQMRNDLEIGPPQDGMTLSPIQTGWVAKVSEQPYLAPVKCYTRPYDDEKYGKSIASEQLPLNASLGHGVGMDQYGIVNMAGGIRQNEEERKYNHEEILTHYYNDSTLVIGTGEVFAYEEYVLASPAGEIRVYDDYGRITGQVNGVIKEEIPGVYYISDSNSVLLIEPERAYSIYFYADSEGSYDLYAERHENGISKSVQIKDITVGSTEIHRYDFDWDSLKQEAPGEGIYVRKDFYGDGLFDEELITGKPQSVSVPYPAEEAVNVSTETTLQWNIPSELETNVARYEVQISTEGGLKNIETIGPFPGEQTVSYDPGTLEHNTTYYWQVKAINEHGIAGQSQIWSFTTDEDFADTFPWTRLSSETRWTPRRSHTSVTLSDDSIVLMGGDDGSGIHRNDVWRSYNYGVTWERVTANAPWDGRWGHSSVTLPDDSIILMGGVGSNGDYTNDVWRSKDGGKTWEIVNESAPWSRRYGHSCVVIDDDDGGKIVLMGGYDDSYRNDIWHSDDAGKTWTQIRSNADWSERNFHSSVVIDTGEIVLMGGDDNTGQYANDVWRSNDEGRNWNLETDTAPWSSRRRHSSVVLSDNSIWLMGGEGTELKSDVWQSTDAGQTWLKKNDDAAWSARSRHTSVSFPNNSIVLLGGEAQTRMNDSWRLVSDGSRIAGRDRYHTAVEISKVGWPNSADTVFIARGDDYADALSGGPLAFAHNAPILLTRTSNLVDVTRAEIKRLGAKEVIILGGTAAVSEDVRDELTGIVSRVERIHGDNRYDTSAKIAEALSDKKGQIDTAMIARGDDFPDALSASSYAAYYSYPILLTRQDEIPAVIKDILGEDGLNIRNTIIAGGTAAISNEVFDDLPGATRRDGDNRYDTAIEVAKHFDELPFKQIFIATGLDYPDAIAGAVLAARLETGIFLVDNRLEKPNEVVQNFIRDSESEQVIILGFEGAISEQIARWFREEMNSNLENNSASRIMEQMR